jgi:uncharacterized RDD family membrane protein YckC
MSLPDPVVQPEFYDSVPFKRAMAWVIDFVATVGLIVTLFTSVFFLPLLFMAISIAYRTVMLGRFGATLGMMVMALTWRRLDGRAPDTGTALFYSAAHAAMWTVFPLQIISVALILLSPLRQGLHDHLLGTTMLRRSATA